MEDNNANIINCYECVHFYVTWEPKFPRACKIFGFKTSSLPSVSVYETTGEVCLAYEKKDASADNRRRIPPPRFFG
jgi:hypothetical protein